MNNKEIVEKNADKNSNAGIRTVRGISSAIDHIIMIISLLLLLIGLYALWDSQQVLNEASSDQYETYKPTAEDTLSFEELKKINPDVFAWLTVYGTNIDYPVVKGKDNFEYLNKNVMGEFALTGSLFLDKRNALDFVDFNSIIYGHHMEKGVMFGDIEKFDDKKFFESRRYGNLYFAGKDHGVEFFDFLEADANDWNVFNPAIKGDSNQRDYLLELNSKAKNKRDIGVTVKDKIVLLSTCARTTNDRHILVGRITDETFADPFADGKKGEGLSSDKSLLDKLLDFLMSIPFWAWLIIILILIIVYNILKEHLRERKNKKQTVIK